MTLRLTLLAGIAYVLLVVLVALEVPLVTNLSNRVDAEIRNQASAQANLLATAAAGAGDDAAALQPLAEQAASELGARVIVVDADGEVVVDSAGAGLRGASYADRPEVAQALDGAANQGERPSEELGEQLLFTAVPVVDGGETTGAVRVTQSVDAVDDEVRGDALALIGVGAVALLFGIGVAWLLAGFLARPIRGLAEAARRVEAGDLGARAPVAGPTEQREVSAAFNEMAARVESVLEAQREFVANASHQLRTPLTGLRLRIEAASDATRDPAIAEDLAAAEAEVERLAALLDDLLVLARTGQDPPPAEVVELGPSVTAAADRFADEASLAGQSIVLDDGGAVGVWARQDEIAIVLDNLVQNALKYAGGSGDLTLGWGRTEVGPGDQGPHRQSLPAGLFYVADRGPGLGAEERRRVTERFFRGSAGATRPGTGLGLAIADAIVRQRSGELRLADREGGGLRAEVRLPAADLDNPGRHFAGS